MAVHHPRCRDCGGAKWTDEGRCADPECRAFPTLGYAVGTLIQETCAIPDGEHAGEPYLLTPEQWRFLFSFYRVDPHAKHVDGVRWRHPFTYFRGAQLCRPQKWGKGPFSAAVICAEGHPDGPVVFDGWDSTGLPVGRPWPTPHIQATAVSEDQVDNIFRALLPMIELGSIRADIPDTGKTRINLPSGGLIEPVTASAVSRLGQRITFAVQDQTESWLRSNKGRQLADNQRRGLAGMGGRFLETPNAWDPAEESVAQQTSEGQEPGVYLDDVDPGAGSVRNARDRRRMLQRVYGDSWWVDLDRIDGEIRALIGRDAAQAERWFLNRKIASEDAAFDPYLIDQRLEQLDIPARSLITIGVDGARFADALAIVATHVATGHQWPLGIWQRPPSAPGDYEHPLEEVDGAMIDAFDQFNPWRVYIDPQWIEHLMERWQGRWGDRRILPWYTNRPRQTAFAVQSFSDAMTAGDWSHNGAELFVAHLKQARRYKLNVYDDQHRQMHSLAKDRTDSPRKIDAAMAAVLSWEARGDAIADGALNKQPRRTPTFL